jgi:hypothetical protein
LEFNWKLATLRKGRFSIKCFHEEPGGCYSHLIGGQANGRKSRNCTTSEICVIEARHGYGVRHRVSMLLKTLCGSKSDQVIDSEHRGKVSSTRQEPLHGFKPVVAEVTSSYNEG